MRIPALCTNTFAINRPEYLLPMWPCPKRAIVPLGRRRLNPKNGQSKDLAGAVSQIAVESGTNTVRAVDQPETVRMLRRVCRCLSLYIGWDSSARVGATDFAKRKWPNWFKRIVRNKNAAPAKTQAVYSSRSAPKPVANCTATPRASGNQLCANRVYWR